MTDSVYRPRWTDAAIAGVVVVGLTLLLARISLLNYGAWIAPACAGLIVLGVFVARTQFPAGRTKTLLTWIGGGLLVVALLFVAVLVLLLVALSNRGA